MSSSSSFAGEVFKIATWPGRVLTDTGRVLLRNSQSCRIFPIAYVGGVVLSLTGTAAEQAGESIAFGVIAAASLYNWALGSRESDPEQTDPSFIENERRRENIETDRPHIAVCGQTGTTFGTGCQISVSSGLGLACVSGVAAGCCAFDEIATITRDAKKTSLEMLVSITSGVYTHPHSSPALQHSIPNPSWITHMLTSGIRIWS